MTSNSKKPAGSSNLSKAEEQKKAARAPMQPHMKEAPKAKPPESGKPVWDKAHSS